MSEKRCYTVKELQEILGVSRPTIYNLLKKNEFRWIQLDGGKYRISKKSFADCIFRDHRSGFPPKLGSSAIIRFLLPMKLFL